MKYGYSDRKDQLSNRLNRIEGQVRGISKMVNDDKYCIDILTQISAAQAALDKVALELLREHTKHCLNNKSIVVNSKVDKVDELVSAVSRLISR
jgi:CsoR family transcriptional regulator, copper-sensing transcriptional repressor